MSDGRLPGFPTGPEHPRWSGGHSRNPAYKCWTNMKARCSNPAHHRYQSYGGRGIVVCDRWLSSFENFINDMGPRPGYRHTIDRINNDGNYEPENCRWATARTQGRNKRTTVVSWSRREQILWLLEGGLPHRQVADLFGLSHSTVAATKRLFRIQSQRISSSVADEVSRGLAELAIPEADRCQLITRIADRIADRVARMRM